VLESFVFFHRCRICEAYRIPCIGKTIDELIPVVCRFNCNGFDILLERIEMLENDRKIVFALFVKDYRVFLIHDPDVTIV
jgi:hypothetical protein